MSTEIGNVNINLRLSLAQFSSDVKQGTEAARTATKDMADTMSSNTQQAKATMALLGEEIGVTIPRHLRTFIAELPGVASAMSAAFNSVAVLALIEVIIKIIEKVQEWKKNAEDMSKASIALGSAEEDAFHKLDEQILALTIRLDDLRNDHLAKVRDELALVNMQSLDTLAAEFDKVGVKADDLFKKMLVNKFESFFGVGDNDAVNSVKAQFDGLLQLVDAIKNTSGDSAQIYDVIQRELFMVNAQLADESKLTEKQGDALRAERGALEALETIYTKVNTIAGDKDKIKTQEDHAKALAESTKRAKELADELNRVIEFANKMKGGRTNMPTLGLPSGDDELGSFGAAAKIGKDQTQTPVYGGTKEAMEVVKIEQDQNEAIKQGQEEYTKTRTAAEQYALTLQRLDALMKAGTITQQVYDKAQQEAQEKMNGTKRAYEQLGQSIGQEINQALLFGKSWTDALKSILVQLGEMIIKMELLKALGDAGGGGGFMSSLIKGITGGRAGGGSVYGGSSYLVGERGPEVFTPGASGFVTPNGGWGGGGVVNNYVDARGATDPAATEMAVRRAINESRQQAVVQAVTVMNEQQKRRR
jgi:hypothetical protein